MLPFDVLLKQDCAIVTRCLPCSIQFALVELAPITLLLSFLMPLGLNLIYDKDSVAILINCLSES